MIAVRRHIKRRRFILIKTAEARVLAGERVDDLLKEIEQLKNVADLRQSSKSWGWVWLICMSIFCLLVITISSYLHVGNTRVQLNLDAILVKFRLAGDAYWKGGWSVDQQIIQFQNVEQPELADFPSREWSGRQSYNVEAIEGEAAVSEFRVSKGVQLSLDHSGDELLVSVTGGSASIVVTLTGKVKVTGRDTSGRPWRLGPTSFRDPPAFVGARGAGQSLIPASVRLRPLDPIVLRNLPVDSLSFLRPQQLGTTLDVRSEIQGGTVRMTDVGETTDLRAGDIVHLTGARGKIVELQIHPMSISVHFEGTLTDISVGQDEFKQNLMPSILDYALHQQRLGFLWGAITGLWGILWGVRKLIAGI